MVCGTGPCILQSGGMLDAVGIPSARVALSAVSKVCQAHTDVCFTTQVCRES